MQTKKLTQSLYCAYNKNMKIEFDPNKNVSNIAKHGLDFADVVLLDWGHAYVKADTRQYDEPRYIALAMLDQRLYVVCFTWRNHVMRVISFRKANKREEERYDERVK